MPPREHDRSRIVEDAILGRFHITRARAQDVGRAVRAAEPRIDATDFEVALLWHRMSNPFAIGWMPAEDVHVQSFLTCFGQALIGAEPARPAA